MTPSIAESTEIAGVILLAALFGRPCARLGEDALRQRATG
jgi:hypothetical protein